MNRRQRARDSVAPGAEDDFDPDPITADSAFDIAEDILVAALEEVRTGRPVDVRRMPRRPLPPQAEEPDLPEAAPTIDEAGPTDETPGRDPGRGRRPRRPPVDAVRPESIEALDGGPTDETLDPVPGDETLDREPQREKHREKRREKRRRRRPPVDAAAPASIEALDSAPGVEPSRAPASAPPIEDQEPEVLVSPRPYAGQQAAVVETETSVVETESPTIEIAPVVETEAPIVAVRRPQTAKSPTTRRRRTMVAIVAALAVLVTGGGILAASSGGDGEGEAVLPGPTAPQQVRLAFDPVTKPDGTSVERAWVLRGERGTRFVGRLSFSNPTAAPLTVSHVEVIPKSLASSVDEIDFEPEPAVLDPDPVVEYSITVPARAEVTVRYVIGVAAHGVQRGRLETWADDMDEALQERSASTTTTTTAVAAEPTTEPAPPPRRGGGSATPAPPPPPPAFGTIILRTISRDGTGTFGYSGPGGSVSITTGGSPTGAGQSGAMGVAVGRYSWTQVAAPGWVLVGIDCTDRDAGRPEDRSTVSGATATFNVQPGETVVCTWTNRPG